MLKELERQWTMHSVPSLATRVETIIPFCIPFRFSWLHDQKGECLYVQHALGHAPNESTSASRPLLREEYELLADIPVIYSLQIMPDQEMFTFAPYQTPLKPFALAYTKDHIRTSLERDPLRFYFMTQKQIPKGIIEIHINLQQRNKGIFILSAHPTDPVL